MPMSVTMTIAAPRGIHRANDLTKGTAITAAVAAAPNNTKTCSARSTTRMPAKVASTKQPSRAKPRADTTTEYSRCRGGSTSLDSGAVIGSVYPGPPNLTRTGDVGSTPLLTGSSTDPKRAHTSASYLHGMSPTALARRSDASPPPLEHHFRAMGSDAHLVVVGGDRSLIRRAIARIDELEGRWSRFRPDSEVTALNTRSGLPMPASADTRLLVARAVEAWHLTGGSFDPTLLDDLLRAGYDRSFEQLRADVNTREVFARRQTAGASGCTDIIIDDFTVTMPAGVAFDAGGIGKGLAADLVATELMAEGTRGVCVNIGGDLRVLGESPNGAGWTLAIEHPLSSTPIALVGLAAGAIATSSVLRRVWNRGGRARHHLLDPATGEPTESDVALASVIAGEAWKAEVLAKASLLRGRARAFDLLDGSTAALVVDHDGDVSTTDTLLTFTGGGSPPVPVDFDLSAASKRAVTR